MVDLNCRIKKFIICMFVRVVRMYIGLYSYYFSDNYFV